MQRETVVLLAVLLGALGSAPAGADEATQYEAD